MGGVLVVAGADRVKGILVPVYEALGLDWRPETTGSVVDEVPGVTWEDAADALEEEYRARHGLEAAELDEATLALARHPCARASEPAGVDRGGLRGGLVAFVAREEVGIVEKAAQSLGHVSQSLGVHAELLHTARCQAVDPAVGTRAAAWRPV